TIPYAQAVNLASECSGLATYYYNSCSGNYGFTWTDTGIPGAINTVTVQFSQSLNCSATGARTTTLNNIAGGTYNETRANCACNPGDNLGITSVVMPNNAYVKGGANTFLSSFGGSCEGITSGQNFGAGNIGKVVVNYGGQVDPSSDVNNCGGCGNV